MQDIFLVHYGRFGSIAAFDGLGRADDWAARMREFGHDVRAERVRRPETIHSSGIEDLVLCENCKGAGARP